MALTSTASTLSAGAGAFLSSARSVAGIARVAGVSLFLGSSYFSLQRIRGGGIQSPTITRSVSTEG
jgi:hypothetical protein